MWLLKPVSRKKGLRLKKNVDSKLLLTKFLRGGQGYDREKANPLCSCWAQWVTAF